MSFEAVLGNKEFELAVFGVTMAVVTRRSASGHGVSVLVSVTGLDWSEINYDINSKISFKKYLYL
jgi:hypothetical protein